MSHPTGQEVVRFLEHHTDIQLDAWQEDFLLRFYAPAADPADVVHVITTLGPTDEPGLVVHAELGIQMSFLRDQFVWAPYIAEWQARYTAKGPERTHP